jgi:hypothetical protein
MLMHGSPHHDQEEVIVVDNEDDKGNNNNTMIHPAALQAPCKKMHCHTPNHSIPPMLSSLKTKSRSGKKNNTFFSLL